METTTVHSWRERNIRLMKTHFPWIAICALSYYIIDQNKTIKEKDEQYRTLSKQNNDEKVEAIRFYREVCKTQADNYFLLIKKQQEDAQKNLEQQKH